jgi:NAD(P)H dehydrogenase (quinone)
MGKILVLFESTTGNTRTMAQNVAAGARKVEATDVRVRSVDEVSSADVLWCDGLAVGTPTTMGVLSWKMKRFWDEVMYDHWGKIDGKIGCAFSSSGGWGGGAELTCMSINTVLMNFGFLVFGVPDYVGSQFTLHYGAVVAGEPREEQEIAACEKLGERLGQWVAVYCDGRHQLHPRARMNKE